MVSGGQMWKKKEAESVECSTLVKSLRDREKWIPRIFLNRSSDPHFFLNFVFRDKKIILKFRKNIFPKNIFFL